MLSMKSFPNWRHVFNKYIVPFFEKRKYISNKALIVIYDKIQQNFYDKKYIDTYLPHYVKTQLIYYPTKKNQIIEFVILAYIKY
jgi:hypothetical protein